MKAIIDIFGLILRAARWLASVLRFFSRKG